MVHKCSLRCSNAGPSDLGLGTGPGVRCPYCQGRARRPATVEGCPVCDATGELPDAYAERPGCHLCNQTGRKPATVDPCERCAGTGHIPPAEEGLRVSYFSAGRDWEARRAIEEIFGGLSGVVRLCDPYYGEGSLATLSYLAGCSEVRFLTQRNSANDKVAFPVELAAFKRQHPTIELRCHSGSDLHDRFVLTDDAFILLGQGIKDPGRKDSFVVHLAADVAGDLIATQQGIFDARWAKANPL